MVEHVERLFYATGQVATQLGVSVATVRLLCENGVIDAETTPGGQWRVPASEVERIKREGLPPIPRPMPMEIESAEADDGTAAAESSAKPSERVVSAQDLVVITRSTLEKRRIDREIEENEDWFREREDRRAAAAAGERQKAEAQATELRRQRWTQEWMEYALDSIPYAARNEVAMEVHAAVSTALSVLRTGELETITQCLVDAAVHRVLRPWQRKQDIQRALKSAISHLPWDVQNKPEWTGLKQLALDTAAKSFARLDEDASYREMAAAAQEAVKPMARAFEHAQTCERMARWLYISDATPEEQERAQQSVRKTLIALPIGTTSVEMEKAKETALAPYRAAIAQRRETARQESEKQAGRRAAESKVDRQLDYIERYLTEEYEFEGGYAELQQEARRLRPLIRKVLIDAVLNNPAMRDEEILTQIKNQIDD